MRSENISANQASLPQGISLKAKLAWQYFFENNAGWIAVKSDDGPWIVMDEAFDLNTGMVFTDQDSFVDWLEITAEEHLKDDPIEFLKSFVSVPDIIDEYVPETILTRIEAVDGSISAGDTEEQCY